MLSKITQGVMGGEENEQMGVGHDLVCFDVEKSMAKRFFGHIVRKTALKKTDTGKVEGMRRGGGPAKTWLQDLK